MPTQYLVMLDFGIENKVTKTGFSQLSSAEKHIDEMKRNPNLKSYSIEKHEHYLIEEWRRHRIE